MKLSDLLASVPVNKNKAAIFISNFLFLKVKQLSNSVVQDLFRYIGIGRPRLYVVKHECAQEEGAYGYLNLLTLANLRLKLGSPSYTY